MGDGNINGASKFRPRHRSNRCPNFTEPETERLIRLVEANSAVILDKRTDKGMLKEKDRVWEDMTVEFNKQMGRHDTPRTSLQLRAKLANMRKRLQDSLNQSETTSEAGDPFEDHSSSTAPVKFNGDTDHANGSPPAPTKLEFVPIAPRPAQPAASPLQHRIFDAPPRSEEQEPAGEELAARLRHGAELRRQELRHREELHALRVTQMRALHELRMREARLRVEVVRRKLGAAESDTEDERSDTED